MTTALPPLGAARGLRLGRAALHAGSRHFAGRLGLIGSERARADTLGGLMGTLLELRGAALKVGQFLSLEDDLLADPLVRRLAGASHRTPPPIGPELARHLLSGAVGPIDRSFKSFEPAPFAAASIGQVHKAITRQGRAVAVKIQYPGIEEAIRYDLRLLRRALGVAPEGRHYMHLLREVEERLLQECDYEQEAESMAWFASRRAVEGVAVPEVFAELCGPGVLTSSLLPGDDFEHWLRTGPSQAARDRAAQRLYDFFTTSLHVHGRIHADPNPGNYLFGRGGTWVCSISVAAA